MVQTRDTAADIVVKPLVLVGMMGVGKTSVGTKLAEMLGIGHVDSDVEIEKAANRTIPEIFSEFGEAYFREGETRVLERLLKAPRQVISTGGGAFIQEKIRDMIAVHGISIWLNADPALLWQRVRLKSGRPLLDQPDAEEILYRLNRDRAPFYSKADIRIDVTPEMDQASVAAVILQKINAKAST